MNVPRAVKKHPLVRQDDGEVPAEGEGEGEGESGPSFLEVLGLIVKYSEFTSVFLWEVQASTVGQIAGNLSTCQNSTLTIYNNSVGVIGQYQTGEYDQAGNASYLILYSIDGIYTACYYMAFEYVDALQVYVATATDIGKLLYNVLHNAGSMYDMGEELYFRIVDFANQGDTS